MRHPIPVAHIDSLESYIPGKRGNKAAGRVIKLSSNENPAGPSPLALEAYNATAATLHRYPEDGAPSLCTALAEMHGVAARQIICGAGSDDVIRMLCHAFAGPGDEVIHSRHGFAMYKIYARQYGATTIAFDEPELRTDIDVLLSKVTERTKLVFIANPNNPTGSYIGRDAIHELRARLPEPVILCLDGAYAEYLDAADYSDGKALVDTSSTVCMRTFSKAYGLPTLRIGWGYGPAHIIDYLYKVRSPFNVSQPAIDAALAALVDTTYLQQHVAMNNTERQRLDSALQALELSPLPSAANFLLVNFGSPERATSADVYLQERGIIIRSVANYDLPHCLRISVGLAEENDALLNALTDWRKTYA